MNLIIEDRGNYLQSIEGESERVCEEKILPPELEDEAATWYYMVLL